MKKSKRLERERRTIQAMIEIYCRDIHKSKVLCDECQKLLAYTMKRIDKCPYQVEPRSYGWHFFRRPWAKPRTVPMDVGTGAWADKPTCAKCPIHCYKPLMRQQVRQVMRYSGPRMIKYHPLLTILHYLDGFNNPNKTKRHTTD